MTNGSRHDRPTGARPNGPAHQSGVALAISLVLLVALTILGVATLSGTRMNEKITSNAQQKAIAFQAAESAIESAKARSVVFSALQSIPADQLNDPAPIAPGDIGEHLSASLDQQRGLLTSVDLQTTVTVQYCGETLQTRGTSLNADESKARFAMLLVDVNGVAQIEASSTEADHVLRSGYSNRETGRTGDCTVPGL